jgi:hypothetical protein
MRFLLPALLLVLVAAAPASAEVTASQIGAPSDPTSVLYDTSAPHPETIAVAGTTTGNGNVDIVCVRGPRVVRLATDVSVTANGTFALADIAVDRIVEPTNYGVAGRTCRLAAVPAGTTPQALDAFTGPELRVSIFTPSYLDVPGANHGKLAGFDLGVAGTDYATQVGSAGACGISTLVHSPSSPEPVGRGLNCGGYPDPQVDGETAYTPQGAAFSPAPLDAGRPELALSGPRLDASGNIAITETNPLVRCAPDPVTCTSLQSAGVELVRTTTVFSRARVVAVTDRWASTDGNAHRLDVAIGDQPCFDFPACSDRAVFRFPGEAAYAPHDDDATTPATGFLGRLPAYAPILMKHPDDAARGGVVVLPAQPVDGVRFYGTTWFDLQYLRMIPAGGAVTLTHYYATAARGTDNEATAAMLQRQFPAPAPAPAPHGGGGPTVTLPRFSRHGRLRVRRAGRTFRVTTRDRVTCAAACTVHVSGRRIAATDLHVAAGERAAVRFRLTRAGARKLRRAGRLRLLVALAAGTVTAARRLTVRAPG